MKSKLTLAIVAFLFMSVAAHAQVDRREVRAGNRDFRKENYREADVDYRRALLKDSLSVAANYNLASTMYRMAEDSPSDAQALLEMAGKSLEKVKEFAKDGAHEADLNYNLGDIAIAKKDWQAAVDAFKESLLRNPGDIDAKENYIYAKKMLENQQNQGGGGGQDQNEDQDNQDQQQDQNQDQQQDQNQDNQQQEQEQQPQPQEQKISPQQAQQMLQAIQAKEKETQDKVNREKALAVKSKRREKNW